MQPCEHLTSSATIWRLGFTLTVAAQTARQLPTAACKSAGPADGDTWQVADLIQAHDSAYCMHHCRCHIMFGKGETTTQAYWVVCQPMRWTLQLAACSLNEYGRTSGGQQEVSGQLCSVSALCQALDLHAAIKDATSAASCHNAPACRQHLGPAAITVRAVTTQHASADVRSCSATTFQCLILAAVKSWTFRGATLCRCSADMHERLSWWQGSCECAE